MDATPRKRRINRSAPSCVYIIVCGDGDSTFAKVGLSGDPDKRLSSLQTGCPLRIHSMYVSRLPTRYHAMAAEAAIHSKMSRFRTRGEWFILRNEALDTMFSVCEQVVAEHKGSPFERSQQMRLTHF